MFFSRQGNCNSSYLRKLVYAILCLTGGLAGYWVEKTSVPYHQMTMNILSSALVETQLFYDTGQGFNERESISQVVYSTDTPVALNFAFSGHTICGLRFDPGKNQVTMKIQDIVIHYHGKLPFRVPLDSLVPVRDIPFHQYDGRTLTIQTDSTAEDPMTLLRQIGPAPHSALMGSIAHTLAGATIALGIAFFFVWVYRNTSNN